jgi:hypothetical protein
MAVKQDQKQPPSQPRPLREERKDSVPTRDKQTPPEPPKNQGVKKSA